MNIPEMADYASNNKEIIGLGILSILIIAAAASSALQESKYEQLDERVSPIGEDIENSDQYRFAEYNGKMLYGPYLVDGKKYFYHDQKVLNPDLKQVNRPQVENLHNFYLKTYTDPLFYSPASQNSQMNLSGFKRFEQDKVLTEQCGLEYEVIPQKYLNDLGENYGATNEFYRHASVENARELVKKNRETINGYAGMVNQFMEVMDKDISQNECFRNDVRENGIAKATLTPVQYRIDTQVFLDYSRMANQNAELALEQVTYRENILSGEESYQVQTNSQNKLKNASYDHNLMFDGEGAKQEFNKRMVSEYETLSDDGNNDGESLPTGAGNASGEESNTEEDEEEEEESEGTIEDMEISEAQAMDIAKSKLNGDWSFQNKMFAEGTLRHVFVKDNTRKVVEVTPEGRIAEIILERESTESGSVEINYTQALKTARKPLNSSWELEGRGDLVSGKYRFKFVNGPLNAEIAVDGAQNIVLLQEIEYLSEALVEGREEEEDSEQNTEESDNSGNNQEEVQNSKARSVDTVPREYDMNSVCLGGESTAVYGWDTNIYPNIISGERLVELSGNANLRDFFTTCRCPYVDVTRLNWYVLDDQFNKISENPVGSKNQSLADVHNAERIFISNPGDETLTQLSTAYDNSLRERLANGEYDSSIPTMWRRHTQESSRLNKFKTAYDDFFNEKHMDVWLRYFPIDTSDGDENFGRTFYNYFLVTESQYPLKFMTYSDSVWRLEDKPDHFSGIVGTSGKGGTSESIPE